MTGFLFCCDPLRPGRADPAFTEEAVAARESGATTALVDHDALVAGDAVAAVRRVPRDSGAYVYRGWMTTSARYAELDRALRARGCTLFTSPAAYRSAHELPGWYAAFAGLTPRSVWCEESAERLGRADAAFWSALAGPLGPGPGIVKDFVKSRKHEWHDACYIPELADEKRLAAVVGRFVALQGEFLAGGVVLRSFEPFVPQGESRIWWVDGEPVLTTAHPDTPGAPVPASGDLGRLLSRTGAALGALGCRFATTDVALREDGVLRVVEVGDGQVSGLPAGADPGPLLAALAEA